MINRRLYIIGNGFDIYHGINSKYSDFRDFVEENDDDLYRELDEYFNTDDLWSDFEETLANIDTDRIIDEASIFLEPYGADNWSDASHHDYQFEIGRRVNFITIDLKKLFTEWILQLVLPPESIEKKIQIEKNNKFISFNYTDTLERLYGISYKNILYIHNKAVDKDSKLIIGHSRDPNSIKSFAHSNDPENNDPRVVEGNGLLDDYYKETYKSTEEIIESKLSFFNNLYNINEIYVLGHSLSEVDIKYFEKIIQCINKNTVKWKISCHKYKDIKHHKDIILNLGINLDLVEFDSIENFDTIQLSLFKQNKL